MSLKIPVQGSAVRELIDMQQLAELTTESVRQLPTLQQARAQAHEIFARARVQGGSVVSVNFVVLRADGLLQLVCIGPKGGYRVRWNFGRWLSA